MTSRPNFFLVGAPKCGTTAWTTYLSSHPDIGFSRHKEPHFFNVDQPGFRWARSEAEYLALFDHCAGKARVGEASVQYLYSRDAAAGIAAFAPDARILIFVREPVAFLRSYHNQLLSNLDESEPDLDRAWTLSDARREGHHLPPTCRERSLLDYPAVLRFGEQIRRYSDRFSRDQLLLIRYEAWVADPRRTYLRVLQHLGLRDDGRNDFPVHHAANHARFPRLARLLRRPPPLALAGARWLRSTLRVRRLGLADLNRRWNTAAGYRSATWASDALAASVRAVAEADRPAFDEALAALQVAE